MTEIVVIAAVAQNSVIGSSNDIPWRLSEDFKRFKRLTLGHPCLMGEATFRSLPDSSRPLPGRENIVLSLNPDFIPDGVTLFRDFDASIEYLRNSQVPKAFVVGGASVYRLAIRIADTLELTRLHRNYVGEVYFPEYDPSDWQLVSAEDHDGIDSINHCAVRFTYETYKRLPRD
ncbi:MAG TPA: dihydrofolate reductase [Polyangiaceae bacterium]|nr:dihydrofolate reductase [Polyangiaceae bacterium]